MIRKIVLAAVLVAGVGTAAPAFANGDDGHLCVAATHDKANPGPAVMCVWLPVDAASSH